MDEIIFEVQGSSSTPYGVVFVRKSEGNLSAFCSCPAGENGQYCKHRFSILEGNSDSIVSDNKDDVKVVQGWLRGTDIEASIIKMRELEAEAVKVKKKLSAAKKAVARAMRD